MHVALAEMVTGGVYFIRNKQERVFVCRHIIGRPPNEAMAPRESHVLIVEESRQGQLCPST